MDIYVVSGKGGSPKRLTTYYGRETPLAFVDSSHVAFSASVQPDRNAAQGDFGNQVYIVDVCVLFYARAQFRKGRQSALSGQKRIRERMAQT